MKNEEEDKLKNTRKKRTKIDHGIGEISIVENLLFVYLVRPKCVMLLRRHFRRETPRKRPEKYPRRDFDQTTRTRQRQNNTH